jgi:hypothetical protein
VEGRTTVTVEEQVEAEYNKLAEGFIERFRSMPVTPAAIGAMQAYVRYIEQHLNHYFGEWQDNYETYEVLLFLHPTLNNLCMVGYRRRIIPPEPINPELRNFKQLYPRL